MNNKTIITALLALIAMTGQGQVKSGLDLCLMDKATGDWLIGLFDDYAVFDCEIWGYAKADTLKGVCLLSSKMLTAVLFALALFNDYIYVDAYYNSFLADVAKSLLLVRQTILMC